MKISIKHYTETLTIEDERDDLKFDEFMDLIKRLSVAMYSEEVVNKYWQ